MRIPSIEEQILYLLFIDSLALIGIIIMIAGLYA